MIDMKSEHQNADILRKNRQYKDAIGAYQKLWDETEDKWDGWGLALCLNKEKQFEKSLPICKKVYEQNKGFDYIKGVYAWAAYYIYIKNYSMDNEYANLDKYGKGILKLTDNKPDDLFRQQTVLSIMEYCSHNNEWIPLLNWADKIDKQYLSKEAFATTTDAGKNITIKSKLESWYTKKSKALEKCMAWQQSLEVCEEALIDFPDGIWFHYRRAKATWHLGNTESALTLFKSILNRKKEWFIYKDIASIHAELNDYSKAKKNIIEGCIASQRIPNREYRWELYYDAAIYFNKTSNPEMAIKYLQLALSLRIENDWKVPDKVTQFANELNVDMDQKIKSDIIFNELKESWKEEKYSDQEKQRGEIKSILPNGKAGFIRSKTIQKDYFFRLNSYNGNKAEVVPKLNVEFYIIESFDKKKNQPSEEAVEIHSIYSH